MATLRNRRALGKDAPAALSIDQLVTGLPLRPHLWVCPKGNWDRPSLTAAAASDPSAGADFRPDADNRDWLAYIGSDRMGAGLHGVAERENL